MSSTETPSRKQREYSRHREEILDVAMRLFVEKGYHNVSMREIAAAAEFATGTLYKFFDGKESLYSELVKLYAHRITGAILASLDIEGDERVKISSFIRAHNRVLMNNVAALQLYFRQTMGFAMSPPDPDNEVSRMRELALQRLTETFAAGIGKGIFRDLGANRMAIALSGLLEGTIFHGLTAHPPVSADDMAAHAEDLFFRGVLAAPPPQAFDKEH